MTAEIFDDRQCDLGEGPLWHPERKQFFWFDILNGKLYSRGSDGSREWKFDRMASAAGWVDRDHLMIGTETGLSLLNLDSGEIRELAQIEADNSATRSNDGRADRQGGFWLGTMGKDKQPKAGAIYRYYRGEVRKVMEDISITNAICFSADGKLAYYTDTHEGQIWTLPLDEKGWPAGGPDLFLDCNPQELRPDGAMIDSEGAICIACWGAGRVVRFSPDGERLEEYPVGGRHSSCPAFGGEDLRDLLVTTAREGMDSPDDAQGLTYITRAKVAGLSEPQVHL